MNGYKWIRITSDQAHGLRKALGDLLVVGYGQLTDLYGEFGTPKIMDTWGVKGADLPLLRATTECTEPRDEYGCYRGRGETEWLLAVHMEDRE